MNRYAQEKIWDYGASRLSRDLGLSKTAVHHWLHGRAEPRPAAARKIAELVGISLADIMAAYEPSPIQDYRKWRSMERPGSACETAAGAAEETTK